MVIGSVKRFQKNWKDRILVYITQVRSLVIDVVGQNWFSCVWMADGCWLHGWVECYGCMDGLLIISAALIVRSYTLECLVTMRGWNVGSSSGKAVHGSWSHGSITGAVITNAYNNTCGSWHQASSHCHTHDQHRSTLREHQIGFPLPTFYQDLTFVET